MSAPSMTDLQEVISKYWGFRSFRSQQEPAMQAVLEGRDSLVVMPTGGGKSLCYQAPAIAKEGTTVVVSPLISLMKDQVDSLQACGISAGKIDSSLSPEERFVTEMDIREGKLKLLYMSPERLVAPDFCRMLREAQVNTFAIDEAHCISHWGHDFRPEYRQLSRLREIFPGSSVHAYTATATVPVRQDICKQLSLNNPEILVGNFDRPNLNFRVLPRNKLDQQIIAVLERHKDEAGIIYCIRRRDVDDVALLLKDKGYNALPYHAGMESDYRRYVQDEFASEKVNIIVATVAFGMGIDRSNIRFILHTGMPKSIEHYQQETGRAGRDGLEAECILLYSGSDLMTWNSILDRSYEEAEVPAENLEIAKKHVRDMANYCREPICRHRALVQYFGQQYGNSNCQACDLCLGDTEEIPDALIVAQKILSCVARVKGRYGINHIISILRKENTEKIRRLGHNELSTYGILSEYSKTELRHLTYQLINQEVLAQEQVSLPSGKSVPVVVLNEASWQVMRGQRQVRLNQLVKKTKEEVLLSGADKESWEGVDRTLFERLKSLRRELAENRETPVPAYVIFGDRTLREMAQVRPSTVKKMNHLYGVGQQKLQDYGQQFLSAIVEYCKNNNVAMDQPFARSSPKPASSKISPTKALAFQKFEMGKSVQAVMELTGKAQSTVRGYLCDYIRDYRPDNLSPWISGQLYALISRAAKKVGIERLKPIFVELQEKVSYDDISIVVAHLEAIGEAH